MVLCQPSRVVLALYTAHAWIKSLAEEKVLVQVGGWSEVEGDMALARATAVI